MPTIILATGNPHKVKELRAIFGAADGAGAEWKIIGLCDLPGGPFTEPNEHGKTFEENARIKALSYATQIGDPGVFCLGDDSGIEIDALRLPDGTPRPGVISSHYSSDGQETGIGREARDAANNARVLRELDGVPSEKRAARFVCCMCLARAEKAGESWKHAILHESRGTMEGRMGTPPRVPSGGNGFGYDPLFLISPSFTQTGAELASDEKNRLSHRGMAARRMFQWAREHLTAAN